MSTPYLDVLKRYKAKKENNTNLAEIHCDCGNKLEHSWESTNTRIVVCPCDKCTIPYNDHRDD